MITGPKAAAPAPAAAPPGHRTRWLAAAVLIVGALMDMIDLTIVNVALPTIRRDLHASATQLEWVVSAYMLAFAAALIIAGSLGDLFGRKRVFLLGVGLFGAASLGAGMAGSPSALIACRVVQGLAAAAMAPQVLATFRTMFAAKERGQAFGLYGAMLGFASAIGLVLGGVLTEASLFGWSWRSVFFVNIPVAVIALVAGLKFIPETRDRAARRPDLPGGALLAGSLVAIVYPLLEGRQLGWPWWSWLLLAAGVAGLAALCALESRRARRQPAAARSARRPVAPLIRPQLFRVPAFAAGLGVQLAFSAGIQGFFLMFALWLQAGEHFSPLRAGLTAIAFSVGSFLVAPVAVPLAQRYGRIVLAAGGVTMAAGVAGVLLGVSHVTAAGRPWAIVPGLVVAGAGLSLLVIPLVNVVLAAVPAQVAGGASGLFSTAQQLGGALGVAIIGTVFFGAAGAHSFAAAFTRTAPYAIGAFALCAVLSLLLPGKALTDEELTAD
ncbi:MAG TPA: MFS transporter [Streptosporangiaceae bacterium]|nr:MFS transporter [Streptosporangiaceae bacterium]